MSRKILHIIAEIKDQYLFSEDTNRPWIIGFSGGKDSTALLQLVWLAIKEIPSELRSRKIYVVCNDTLVENPIIAEYVIDVLQHVEQAAIEQGLPIEVKRTIPRLEDSFWVNIVGRGYPVPNNSFRWCTDKMKIKPTSRFIAEQVAENGEAIILLGARISESNNRANSIKKRAVKGKRLTKHPNHLNTYVYTPIKDLMLEEVWYIINTMTSPWGASNDRLYEIYSNASADDYECPTMVTNKKHTSCGQSRFGCWTCTLVKEDKSMSAMVNNGQKWLKPLLDLRTSLIENRNISENRMPTRRNGQRAVTEDGHNQGNYTEGYRASLLEEILIAQRKVQEDKPSLLLITNQELIAIQVVWNWDLNFKYKVSDIYNKVYNKELQMKAIDEKLEKEVNLLKEVCKENPSDFDLIQELLTMQKNKALLNRKRGLKDDMERVIEKYLQKEGK
jgi:DNA sulfur modification protein DndC